MRLFRHQPKPQYWRLDGQAVAVLGITLPSRQRRLPLTVAQVNDFITVAAAAQVQPQILLTVASRDVSKLMWRQLGIRAASAAPIKLVLPASVVRDFIDNATGSRGPRAVACGELLDGWPMHHARSAMALTRAQLLPWGA